MKYMGSKARIAKHILPIILKDRIEDQHYVEPFVGGGNMIEKVVGPRTGADSDHFVIGALSMIRDDVDSIPKNNLEFTEYDYKKCKAGDDAYSAPLRGYAGFAFSFGAIWFSNWAKSVTSKKVPRDHVAEQYRAAIKQNPKLQGCELVVSSYLALEIPENSIIYCDPPYAGTTKYKDDFNHEVFWEWCREKVTEGHKVFVSEYNAPDDFTCVWEKEITSGLHVNTTKKGVEKLFVHHSQL